MTGQQFNIQTSETLARELDSLVDRGYFRNRAEAINEGIKLLIRNYRAKKIGERIDRIAEGPSGKGNLTKALIELREEE